MSDVHRVPDEQRVLQEASEWIARLAADDAAAEDKIRFEAWRRADPLHGQAFERLTDTWTRFAEARHAVSAAKFEDAITPATKEGAARARTRSRLYRLAWAAALIGMIVAISAFIQQYQHRGRTYVTTIGEHATFSLPDGSTLELDGDTRARVDFSAHHRVVYLTRGEAYFKVTHNPHWPFWVVGGNSWVRDVGTAFNVQLSATGMRITVSHGTVKIGAIAPLLREIAFRDPVLYHAPALSVLTAGHQAYVSNGSVATKRLTAAQLDQAISWRAQILYFENAPLSEVADQLGRYTHLPLAVIGRRLRKLPVAGTFQANSNGAESFLDMLSHGLGLTVERRSDEIIITSARSSKRNNAN